MILCKRQFIPAKDVSTSYGVGLLVFLCISLLSVISVSAQDSISETVPPPIIAMSKDEASKLNAEKSEKNRTKLALDLMELRLLSAEKARSSDMLNEMYTELGAFQALVIDTIKFLDSGSRNRKNLGGFKRFEIGLRRLAPMIEVLRREVPTRYEGYIQNLSKFVRKTRARAIEPMFGNNIVRDDQT